MADQLGYASTEDDSSDDERVVVADGSRSRAALPPPEPTADEEEGEEADDLAVAALAAQQDREAYAKQVVPDEARGVTRAALLASRGGASSSSSGVPAFFLEVAQLAEDDDDLQSSSGEEDNEPESVLRGGEEEEGVMDGAKVAGRLLAVPSEYRSKHEAPPELSLRDGSVPTERVAPPDPALLARVLGGGKASMELAGEVKHLSLEEGIVVVQGVSLAASSTRMVYGATGMTGVLDEGSWLFSAERQFVGRIGEVFGPVSEPLYVLVLPQEHRHIDLSPGTRLFAAMGSEPLTKFVSPELCLVKGSDASNWHDEEPAAGEDEEFSDDEKEAEAKRRKRRSHNKNARMSDMDVAAMAASSVSMGGFAPFLQSMKNAH
jgi:rRNA processing protein Gar1